jgi:hypothetical protein
MKVGTDIAYEWTVQSNGPGLRARWQLHAVCKGCLAREGNNQKQNSVFFIVIVVKLLAAKMNPSRCRLTVGSKGECHRWYQRHRSSACCGARS